MPHNRTRLWVGLAIIGVTIPAVGTYYTHSAATSDLRGNAISAAGQNDLSSRQEDSFGSGRIAMRQPLRDYQAEVNAALAQNGVYPDSRFESDSNYDTYDDLFDVNPLDDIQTDAYGRVNTREVPNPSALLASGNGNLVAYSTDGAVTDDGTSTSAGSPPATIVGNATTTTAAINGDQAGPNDGNADFSSADGYLQPGSMSDSDVYQLVLRNLSGPQRDDFVRTYGVMSAEQRAQLLDGFRQQMQSGG